jgi:putative FmdB family regulatory protein
MPIYEYECGLCKHVMSEYQKMSSPPLTKCPMCTRGLLHRIPSIPHTNLVEFSKPIEMLSIGLNDDDEIRAFKQKCPDVDVSTNPKDELYGIPIARNRAQKKAALDAMGFEEKS